MDARIIKATFQSAILSGLSNIIDQLIRCYQANNPYTINPTELAQFILFSILVTPPNFLWQAWLEGRFPAYTASSSTASPSKQKKDDAPTSPPPKKTLNKTNTAAKFALDQTLGAGANTVLFIAGIALLRGHDFQSIQEDVREKFWPMIFAGQKPWPLVSVLSFTVVPLESRTLFGGTVGLFWGVYLSLVSGGRK